MTGITTKPAGFREGPSRAFLPVSVRRDLGFSFVDSPLGYEDTEGCNAEDVERGQIVIDARTRGKR